MSVSWRVFVGFTLVVLISFAAAGPLSSGRSALATATGVTVLGSQPWTDTGVDVANGEYVTVSASGVIHVASSDPGKSPDGTSATGGSQTPGTLCTGFLVDNAGCWSLVAMIGIDTPLMVGTAATFTTHSGGRLYLGVNDNYFADNTGSWSANVTVASQSPQPAAEFHLLTTSAYIYEGATPGTPWAAPLGITRSNTAGWATVFCVPAGDTAQLGTDLQATSVAVVFADGQSYASCSIPTFSDGLPGLTEHANTTLDLGSTGGVAVGPIVADLFIKDVDGYGTFSFVEGSRTVDETAGNVSFVIARSGSTTGGVILRAHIEPIDAQPGVNYNGNAGDLFFDDGWTNSAMSAQIRNDGVATGNRSLRVVIDSVMGSHATIGAPAVETVTIADVGAMQSQPPTISSVSPSPLPMNYAGTVDIYGSGFDPMTLVRVNGQQQGVATTFVDADHLQATIVPAMVLAPSILIDLYDPSTGLSSGSYVVAVVPPVSLMAMPQTASPGGLVTFTATVAAPSVGTVVNVVLDGAAFASIESVSVGSGTCTPAIAPIVPPQISCVPLPIVAGPPMTITVVGRLNAAPPPTGYATASLVVNGTGTFSTVMPIPIVPPVTLAAALLPAQTGSTVTVTAAVAPQPQAASLTLTFDSSFASVQPISGSPGSCTAAGLIVTCPDLPAALSSVITVQATVGQTPGTANVRADLQAGPVAFSTSLAFPVLPPPSVELRYVDANGNWQPQQRIENLIVGSRAQACLFSVTPGGLVTPLLEPALNSLADIIWAGSGGSVGGGGGTSFADAQIFASFSGNSAGATCFSWVSAGAGEQAIIVAIPDVETHLVKQFDWDTNGDWNNMPLPTGDQHSLIIGWNDLEGMTVWSSGTSATGTIANPPSLTTTFLNPPEPGMVPSTGVTVAFVGSHKRADGSTYRSGQPIQIQQGPPVPNGWSPPPADGLVGIQWTASPSCGQLPPQPLVGTSGAFPLVVTAFGCETQPILTVTISGHAPPAESGVGLIAGGTLQIPGGSPPIFIGEGMTLDHDILAACSGIIMMGDNITIDLGGHTITGPHPNTSSSPCVGIDVTGHIGVTIRNGTIQGFSSGVRIWQQASGNTVDSLVSRDNWFNGVTLVNASNTTITKSIMTGNAHGGGAGIVLSLDTHDNTIANNTITGNYGAGIIVYVPSLQPPPQPLPASPSNNTITNNQFSGNPGGDINDLTTGGGGPGGVLNVYSSNVCSTSTPAVLCASPRTYVVTDPGDGSCGSQVCTLRDAINAANAHPNAGQPDTIAFAPGIGTILTNGLPAITEAVILDGTTAFGQGNSCESHDLAVSIRRAAGSTYNGPGLYFSGNGSTIRGIAIGGFGPVGSNTSGIPGIVLNASGATVECNNLGIDTTGANADANGAGIIVTGANNVIRNNVLSGNVGWAGIALMSSGANANVVEGNSIGTNAAGNSALPNTIGIAIAGGQGNMIRNNLVSGNLQAGIALDATPQGVSPSGVATGNTITDNLIGMSLGAQSPLPNAVGIAVNNGANNQFTRNVIAYNTNNGAVVNLLNNQPLQGNVFSQNTIHHNGGQGLSVAGPQIPNVFYDHLPPDLGWATMLSAAVGSGFGGNPITPGTLVRFEFFHSATCSPTLGTFGLGQGEAFFAADTETVGASGGAVAKNVDISTVPSNHFITVTATLAERSTSGFSRCISPGLRIDPAEQHAVSVSQSDQMMTISGWGIGSNTFAFMGNPDGLPTPLEVVSRTTTTSMQVKIPASRLGTMGSFNLFLCNSTDVTNAPFALGCSPTNSVQVEPVLTGSTPQLFAGSPTTTLTVAGTGFASTPAGMQVLVSVNGASGVEVTPSNVSATQFAIPISAGWLATTGQLQIRVRVPGPQPTSNTITVSIINPAPHLTSLSSSSAVVGAGTVSVTLTGSGFRPESVVEGAPTGATWSVTDASHIALSLPTPTVGTLGLKVFTSGPGGGTSETLPFFVTQAAAPVSMLDAESVSNSQVTVSTGAPSTNAPSVQASTDAGSGTVAVAVYGANPGGTPSFATGTSGGTNGTFVDVYVAPGSTFTSTTIQICDPNGGDVLYWYDSTSQAWVQLAATIVSGQTSPPTCFSLTVTDSSVPSLTDLQGAIFGVGLNRKPTAGTISGPSVPIAQGGAASMTLPFTDPDSADIHTVSWNWGDGSNTAGTVTESGGSGTGAGSHIYAAAGIYAVLATVSDNHGQIGSASFQFVVVFDPSSAGHGSGWFTSPSGTSTAKPNVTGKAEFGFELKYKKGSTTPTGDFEFHFDAAGIEFHELSIDWLVVSDPSIVFRGTGKLGNSTGYSFQVWSTTGGKGVGTVRVRIWKASDGTVIYDSEPTLPPSPTIKIGGGKIAIKD